MSDATSSRSAARASVAPIVGLLLAFVGLSITNDLNAQPFRLFSLLLLAFGSLGTAVWIYARRSARGIDLPGVKLLLLWAVALRILALPLPPSLSNDVQRYLWDGHVATAGHNPYLLAPDAPQLESLSSDSWARVWDSMSHHDVETVYPPVALFLFSIAAAGSDLLGTPPVLTFKLLLVVIDLLGCGALLLLARRMGIGVWRTILYLWNPLVVLEVAGMGHVDGAGLLPVALVILLLAPSSAREGTVSVRTAGLAALSAVVAVLVKLVPIVALPFWWLVSGRRPAFLGVALVLLLVAISPVISSTGGVPPGLAAYGVHWEFNGPLFEPLQRIYWQVGAPDLLRGALDLAKWIPGVHRLVDPFYPHLYVQMMAKITLALVLLALLLFGARMKDWLRGTEWAFGAALLCSATFYPWYLLWVLPWAALRLSWPWLMLSGSILLSYLPRVAGVEYFPWVYLLVWGPPLLVLVAHVLVARRVSARIEL